MTDYADVTVVMPTIEGREALRERALASVRAQTVLPADTIVVVDDQLRGAAWARNQGLARVRTRWVAWLDDDDELFPQHLEALLVGQGVSGADLVYSYPEFVGVDEHGRPARDPLAVSQDGVWVKPFGVPFGPEQENHLRYQGNFIPVTYLADAAKVRAAGGFPPSGGKGMEEDYQLLINLLNDGATFHHVAEITWRYHFHDANTGGGVTGTGASNRDAFR